jgi:hypothetical protein
MDALPLQAACSTACLHTAGNSAEQNHCQKRKKKNCSLVSLLKKKKGEK